MQKNITHILPPKVELRSNISNLKSFSTQLQCSSKYEIVWTNVVKILLIFFYLSLFFIDSFSLFYLSSTSRLSLLSTPLRLLALFFIPLWWWSVLWVINSSCGRGFSCLGGGPFSGSFMDHQL